MTSYVLRLIELKDPFFFSHSLYYPTLLQILYHHQLTNFILTSKVTHCHPYYTALICVVDSAILMYFSASDKLQQNPFIFQILGKEGQIDGMDYYGVMSVIVNRKRWMLNRLCLEPTGVRRKDNGK